MWQADKNIKTKHISLEDAQKQRWKKIHCLNFNNQEAGMFAQDTVDKPQKQTNDKPKPTKIFALQKSLWYLPPPS